MSRRILTVHVVNKCTWLYTYIMFFNSYVFMIPEDLPNEKEVQSDELHTVHNEQERKVRQPQSVQP